MSEETFTLDRLPKYGGFKGKYSTIEETVVGDYRDLSLREIGHDNDNRKKLEKYIWDPERDVFIFDDHNSALAAWIGAYNSGLLGDGSALIHVDQHFDQGNPSYNPNEFPPPPTLNKVQQCVSRTSIIEFIKPAKEWGIFDGIKNWGVKHFDGFSRQNEKGLPPVKYLKKMVENYESFALDIDIDVFQGMKEGAVEKEYSDMISKLVSKKSRQVGEEKFNSFAEDRSDEESEIELDFDKYYKAMAEGIRGAKLTTIATSPGLIDQEEALEHIEGIFEYC